MSGDVFTMLGKEIELKRQMGKEPEAIIDLGLYIYMWVSHIV